MPTNDTPALHMTLNNAISISNGLARRRVNINKRMYLDSPLRIGAGVRGLIIEGHGAPATGFTFGPGSGTLGNGATRGPSLVPLVNARDVQLKHLAIDLDLGRDYHDPSDNFTDRVTSVLRFSTALPGQSARCRIEDVLIELRRLAMFGIEIGPGDDVRNDWMELDRVFIANYISAGVVIQGRQSKENILRDCVINGNDIGKTGILCMDGSFHFDGKRVGGNTEQDFYIHWFNGDSFSIRHYNSENSARMLVAGNRGGSPSPMLITEPRFASNKLHPDRRMIIWKGAGPLTILGGTLGSGAHTHLPPIIDISESPTQRLTIIGTDFGQHGSALHPIVKYDARKAFDINLQGIIRRLPSGEADSSLSSWESFVASV